MSHVGKHMQEISHAAIPMSAMTHDDGDLEVSDEGDNSIHDSVAVSQIAEPESVFIVPPGFRPNSIFVGRETEIEQLENLLIKKRPRDQIHKVSVVLHGILGIGKSEIAREFAFANRDKFKGGIFWIPAKSKKLMFDGFNNLMRKLAIPDEFEDPILSVDTWLGQRRDWLLILDGLDLDMNGHLSELGGESPDGRIIYVTRSLSQSTWHRRFSLEIGHLSNEASQSLLFKELDLAEVTERQRANATKIIERVGGLPLAIHAIARRLLDTNQSLEDFRLPVTQPSLESSNQKLLEKSTWPDITSITEVYPSIDPKSTA